LGDVHEPAEELKHTVEKVFQAIWRRCRVCFVEPHWRMYRNISIGWLLR